MTPEQRARAFLVLTRHIGREVTADFLRHADEHCPAAGVPTIHSLIEGTYKPKDSPYAFCIWSRSATRMDREIRPDNLESRPDGSWTLDFVARAGSLDSAVNRSLFACMNDRQPVLVIVTCRAKGGPGGARYRILGPALIKDFDPATRRFRLSGNIPAALGIFEKTATPVEVEEACLRQQLILPLVMGDAQPGHLTSREAREQAFRSLILKEYSDRCCVCRSQFRLEEGGETLVEAVAAHIVPLDRDGPDDLRNGLAFCPRHRWAFRHGLFTLTEDLRVEVSPSVNRAQRHRFDLEEYKNKGILQPANPACRPDPALLEWHRRWTFRAY
jgi:hypothetical protein